MNNEHMHELLTNAYMHEKAKRNAVKSLIHFSTYVNPMYKANWHHKVYASKLDEFINGNIKKLMVFMPPQTGKSELCSRMLPAKLLGDYPNKKVAIVSYNHSFASKFNRDVQRIIDSQEYQEIYPNTNLNTKNVRTVVGTWLRNADEFEVVGKKGGLVSVGTGGGLTGRAVDILIIDDPYKDHMEAWSSTIRGRIQDWYDTVANTRLHNNSQQLITLTRWHPDDLVGTLLKRKNNEWEVVVFPALKIGVPNNFDPRSHGESLWEEMHSVERLNEIRNNNPGIFESLYQQDPKPSENYMFINPEYESEIKLIYNGVAHIDAAYGGKDGTAFTILKRNPEGLVMFGKRWNKHVDDCLNEIYGLLELYRAGTIYMEENSDKGYLRKNIIAKGKPTNGYYETMNKFIKISTYLRKNWRQIKWIETTDPEYIKEILDYNEHSERDDCPDSAASLIRETENKRIWKTGAI